MSGRFADSAATETRERAAILLRRGGEAFRAGDVRTAARAYVQAVVGDPQLVPAWINLAVSLLDLDQVENAVLIATRASTLAPGEAGALSVLARALALVGRLDAAAGVMARATRIEPGNSRHHDRLATILGDAKRFDAADESRRRALALAPEAGDAWRGFAEDLLGRRRWSVALSLFRRAARLNPLDARALAAWSATMRNVGREIEADRLFERAVVRDPGSSAVLAADPGEMWSRRASLVDPEAPEPRHNLGLHQLARGDLAAGWEGYARRFAALGFVPRPSSAPAWNGEDLSGRAILVWREQGVGDEILFAGCLPDIVARAGRVIVECDPRLVSLLARSFPRAAVVAEGGPHGPIDFHVPLGDLPRLTRRRLADFPARAGHLIPDPAARTRAEAWLRSLGPGLRVGLCRRSGKRDASRDRLYPSDEDWAAALRVPGLVVVDLQYDGSPEEAERAARTLGLPVHRAPGIDLRDDFEATAGLIAGLDLVVSAGTAVAETAAALGVPVWRVAPRDWTHLGTLVRPWFPSMRPFVVEADFAEVCGRVAGELRRIAAARPISPATRVASPLSPPTTSPLLGVALDAYRRGELERAWSLARRAIADHPDDPRAGHFAGVVARRVGSVGEGVAAARRAALLAPADAEIAAAFGSALAAIGETERASGCFRRALLVDPASSATWAALARASVPVAVDGFRRAARLTPGAAPIVVELAITLIARERLAEARRALSPALAVEPASAEAWTNLGNASRFDAADAAERAHRRAIHIDPALPDPHSNLGLLLQRRGRWEEARVSFEAAIERSPRFAIPRHALSLGLLERGDLRRGWAEHEWRFGTPQFVGGPRRFAAPVWRGQNIADRRLLIWDEQGVGDEILFSSCFADAIERAGHVIVECDRRLVGLLARSFPQATVRARTPAPDDFDAHIPAGSLPRICRGDLARFPVREAWLRPAPALVGLFRRRLAATAGLRVGLTWRSGLSAIERDATHLRLVDLGPVLTIPGLTLVSLQYGDTEAEIREAEIRFGVQIRRWDDVDLKNDFEATAALTSALDLVVATGNATGELAGALGVPVWRMCCSDWTHLGTGVRPWFPTMRLFSPDAREEMSAVPPRVAEALRRFLVQAPAPAEERLEAAVGLHKADRLLEARRAYAAILADDSGNPVARHLLGLVEAETGDPIAGEARIRSALSRFPDYHAAMMSLAGLVVRRDAGAAAGILRRAVSLSPDDPAAATNLGNALDKIGGWAEAERPHRRAARLAPDAPEPRDNLGVTLSRLGRAAEAAGEHRAAIRLAPDFQAAWSNLARVERGEGRFDVAFDAARRALALDPADAETLSELGRIWAGNRAWARAERSHARATAVVPGLASACFNRSLIDLARGRLDAGWAGYARRFEAPDTLAVAPFSTAPEWMGETLVGKRLLVWGEQGIGDEILFASLLPDLLSLGGTVILSADPRLHPLFSRSFPSIILRARGEEGNDHDVRLAAGTLPGRLRRRLLDFSRREAFLVPDPDRVSAARRFPASWGEGLRVGLCWRSSLINGERRGAYLSPGDLAPIVAVPGVLPVCLQHDVRDEEMEAFARAPFRVPDLDVRDDIDGTAALIAALDLVVTAATWIGELAGAVGTPVWRLGHTMDWTTLGTAVRPWYPSMRVFAAEVSTPFIDTSRVAAGVLRALSRDVGHENGPGSC